MKVYDLEDTIAAVATARGEGGIGIIRITGPHALNTAKKIFQPKKPLQKIESHRLYYGDVVDPSNNSTVDEILLSYMKAPNSFTKEDVVEINSHGGSVIVQKIMEILLREGIREAGPGEFTKRAFLNGRIDLSQAEAVIDLIRAKTEGGLRVANRQLKGGLSERLDGIKEDLIYVLAVVESYIDFPEEDIDLDSSGSIKERLKRIGKSLKGLVDSYEEGRIYREGIHVVIAGRPNVGKSSLLNALLEEKRAIVTSVPGTTRDVIEEVINIKGIPVNLIDTAGIRETKDLVEEEGVRRAREKLEDADLILYMVDDKGLYESDLKTLEGFSERSLLVINKVDIMADGDVEKIGNSGRNIPFVPISAKSREGIEGLKEAVYETVTHHSLESGNSVVVSRKRHKIALERAIAAVERGTEALDTGGGAYEFIAVDMKEALTQIGEIVGETTTEDILERIFGEFCIGK